MQLSIVFAFVCIVALAYAAPQKPSDQETVILKQENNNIGVGPWSWAWETSDGSAAQETGVIENEGTDDEAIATRGSFQYVSPEGQLIRVNWVADRNGFRADGDHLPKA